MNPVDISYDLLKTKEGLDAVTDAVKITLGPNGKFVALYEDSKHYPSVTNDGVTVARRLHFQNAYKDLGAQLVQEASQRTEDMSGDGTTTACILMQTIVTHALKAARDGAGSTKLAGDLREAAKLVVEALKKECTPVKDATILRQVATISCRDPKVGQVVGDLLHDLGADSYVTIEDYPIEALIPEKREGLRLRGMLPSTFFFTNKILQEAVLPTSNEMINILVVDHPITLSTEALKIMETVVSNFAVKEAVLVAPEIGGTAMQAILNNWDKGVFRLLPMKVVAFGKNGEGYMRDICAATGGEYVTAEDGKKLEDLKPEWFGSADKVIGTFYELAVVGGHGDSKARIKEIKAQIPNLREFEADSARERIAKLQSKIATLKVGSDIDSVRETKKKLVEDAVNASRAAMRAGIVAGGGAALYRASQVLDERIVVHKVLKDACLAPLKQLARNSEITLSVDDMDMLRDRGTAMDFRTGEIGKAFEDGVIDPFEVVSTALLNAVNMSAQFILTAAAIVPIFSEDV